MDSVYSIEESQKKEYHRYDTTCKLLELLYTKCSGERTKYEAKNILERYLINMINFGEGDDPVFKKYVDSRIIKEFCEKDLCKTRKEAIQLLRDFEYIIDNYLDGKFDIPDYTQKSPDDIDQKRYEKLSEYGTIEDISNMNMRYNSILNTFQQWGFTLEQYKLFYEFAKVYNKELIEAFASPLNSKMLMISDKPQYCSAFPDTDSIFCSLGNFFNINIEGKFIVVNPPFTEDIIRKTVDKILEAANKKSNNNFCYMVLMSRWEDLESYCKLMTSPLCLHREWYTKETYKIDSSDKHIIAHFNTTLFVLGRGVAFSKKYLAT